MMELVASRAAFVRLGFTPQASKALVDEQGLDSLDEIKRLDDNVVSEHCKTIDAQAERLPMMPVRMLQTPV
jgi:hypothetical protein